MIRPGRAPKSSGLAFGGCRSPSSSVSSSSSWSSFFVSEENASQSSMRTGASESRFHTAPLARSLRRISPRLTRNTRSVASELRERGARLVGPAVGDDRAAPARPGGVRAGAEAHGRGRPAGAVVGEGGRVAGLEVDVEQLGARRHQDRGRRRGRAAGAPSRAAARPCRRRPRPGRRCRRRAARRARPPTSSGARRRCRPRGSR